MIQRITRLAPSPTGALHLGNARTFLVNFLLARTRGWRIVLRMEDIDSPRVKPEAAGEALTDLEWLGLGWDQRAPDQSQRSAAYKAALDQLVQMGRAYPCTCTRRDVERAASAPHEEDGQLVYPGLCRGRYDDANEAAVAAGREPSHRLAVNQDVVEFEDMMAGPQRFDLAAECGDFVILKSDGMAAYQLAVVLDDAATGVTDVVRGHDLLDSTPRQLLIIRLLGLSPEPRYWHLPLVVGPDGRRLAKRHGDTRLSQYRHHGVSVHRILGLLGYWTGLLEKRRPTDMAELLERFDIDLLPANNVVFAGEDEEFLVGK